MHQQLDSSIELKQKHSPSQQNRHILSVNAGLKLHHWPERKYISLGALGLSMVPHGGVLLYSDGGVRGCGQTGFWCLCLGFARLTAVFEAKALAVHFQNVDMVG